VRRGRTWECGLVVQEPGNGGSGAASRPCRPADVSDTTAAAGLAGPPAAGPSRRCAARPSSWSNRLRSAPGPTCGSEEASWASGTGCTWPAHVAWRTWGQSGGSCEGVAGLAGRVWLGAWRRGPGGQDAAAGCGKAARELRCMAVCGKGATTRLWGCDTCGKRSLVSFSAVVCVEGSALTPDVETRGPQAARHRLLLEQSCSSGCKGLERPVDEEQQLRVLGGAVCESRRSGASGHEAAARCTDPWWCTP
jgi:hypothetical protein